MSPPEQHDSLLLMPLDSTRCPRPRMYNFNMSGTTLRSRCKVLIRVLTFSGGGGSGGDGGDKLLNDRQEIIKNYHIEGTVNVEIYRKERQFRVTCSPWVTFEGGKEGRKAISTSSCDLVGCSLVTP